MEPEGRRLAGMGWVALSVDYRVNAPNRWPDELHDVQQAVRWVAQNSPTLGVDADRIGLFGASAGGHLAALIGTLGTTPDVTGKTEPDEGEARVRAVATYSAPLDLNQVRVPGEGSEQALPAQVIERFLGCAKSECPETYTAASPINHVGPQTAPMYMANATDEVIPRDQPERMAEALDRHQIAYEVDMVEGSVHGLSENCSRRPCARGYEDEVWDATVAFLASQLAPGTIPPQASNPPRPAAEAGASRWPAIIGVSVIGLLAATLMLRRHRRARRSQQGSADSHIDPGNFVASGKRF
jgi:acetyl esterase/lipase